MTDLAVARADIRSLNVPVVLTGARPGEGLTGLASAELLSSLGFTGQEGQVVRVPAGGLDAPVSAPVVAVVGLGEATGGAALRRAVGAGVAALGPSGSSTAAAPSTEIGLAFEHMLPIADNPALAAALAEGALFGAHDAVRLVFALNAAPSKAVKRALERARVLGSAVRAARVWVNEPPNRLYPASFADAAQAAARGSSVKVRVLDETALAKGGYGGLIAVGQGSIHPPRLVVATYSPSRARRHIALVGKGITFDSGGLSLKPRSSLPTMKYDMAGAAAVFQALLAVATLKVPVKVSAYLCLAENLPSGAATRPSDVIIVKD
ncbi:MAG: hypothetical protein LBE08_02535, partial [Bifidobacteriaceae bacterium]|nr:hypothetical protein [Bifidobacteriaceae bacterium]